MFLAIFGTIACVAQTNDPQTVTNWGKSVCGVQLSVALSNNIVAVGSAITVHCWIRNSSTNVVTTHSFGQPRYDFDVSLIDDSGKVYDLTPERSPQDIFFNTFIGIDPNKIYESDILLQLDKQIQPGNYELKVTRGILIQRKGYGLESNLLEVQIK